MQSEPGPLVLAWAEARHRVFSAGFDRAFQIVLALAYVAGAIFLGVRHGGADASSIAAGFVSMALFLAMPLVTIFTYLLGLSFLARRAGAPDDADPPMVAVLAALALAIGAASLFVGGAFWLPVVGEQMRQIFL